MLKRLSNEKLEEIIEAGIAEFAEHGLMNSSMSSIARRAGISVGVLYKYYEDKDAFFIACLKRSLSVMESFLIKMTKKEQKPIEYAKALIKAVQKYSRENSVYIRMYHEITSNSNREIAHELAVSIEGMTSRLYTGIIQRAQANGDVRRDLDPALFAFFFDNLMMMMQFSYCCPYYQERYRLYRDKDIAEDDKLITDQLIRFLESAFTFEQTDIKHRTTLE